MGAVIKKKKKKKKKKKAKIENFNLVFGRLNFGPSIHIAMSTAVHQQKSVILPRLLGLRDHSPFILIIDTIAQSSRYLEAELFHKIPKVCHSQVYA
jgi:hypothetical protein